MKFFLLLLTFFLITEAEEVQSNKNNNLDIIKLLDKGVKRDFYINEYLKEDISDLEAFETLSLIDDFTNEIFYNFAKKFNHDETLAVAQCMNMDTKDLINSYADCIVIGLSLKEATTLSSIDLDLIMQKTVDKYPNFTKNLKVVSSSIPFTKLIVSNKDDFYKIFLSVNDNFRTKYFNYKLPKRTFKKIFADKKNFEKFLQVSLTNTKLDTLQKSLLEIDDKDLNVNSSFLLALNALRYNNISKAVNYLDNAKNKTKSKKVKDKILFWKYQATKEKNYLTNLSNSLNKNLYSLYANEMLGKSFNNFTILENVDIFNFLLEDYDLNRVSSLLSITKVKSNFNSNKISKEFNLGIMQLNRNIINNSPYLSSNTISTLDYFSIKDNLKIANTHLDQLEKTIKNPLFLALVYETNYEYLNNKLENGLFLKKSIYEPFMSLELTLNGNKEYLKDFLVYKYLYQNYLEKEEKNKITFASIFESLFASSQKLDE